MGTSTIFVRFNDMHKSLRAMTKTELNQIDNLSPYGKDKDKSICGWRAPLELHNGNIYVLISWKGRLMNIEVAPENLTRKYYNKYSGKTMNIYEWTLLKKSLLRDIERLDKKFKKLVKPKKDN